MPSKCGSLNRKNSFGCAYLSTKGDDILFRDCCKRFYFICYVRNVMFSFNLHCQHRAIMPPQQKCKNRLCKENQSNQPNKQCPHNTVYPSKPLALYLFSPQHFSEMLVKLFFFLYMLLIPGTTEFHRGLYFQKNTLQLTHKKSLEANQIYSNA